MKLFKHFLQYYKPYKTVFFLDLLCASIISIVDLAFPLILNFCTDNLFMQSHSKILSTLGILAIALLALYLLRSVCRYYVSAQGHIMGANMEKDMRKDLFDQYQRLSFSYYDRHNTGVMMSRVVSDLFDISEFAHHGPENLFISLVKIFGSFIILYIIYWPLALLLSIVTFIMLVFSYRQNKSMQKVFMDNRRKIGDVNARLQNYYVMGTYHSTNNFFQGLLYITVIIGGGYFIATSDLSPITLATFALYINIFIAPIEVLIEFTEMFQKGLSGFKRFEEVMKEVPDIQDKEGARDLHDVKGDICFDHVSFSYNQDENVLNDVNLTIPAGKKVALVGPSGSGKTTLCSLVSRFYDVKGGKITLDGVDIREYKVKSLRQCIGLVQQDVYLFTGTIEENIAYGKLNATHEEIVEAAKKANIHDFIMSLPEGYDTFVGERGTRLSGGQKQRISIARVFLKDPKILILDEATSALDNESERIIQKSLEELSKNRTCITIAHRLSTIRNSNEIVVLDSNGLHERGTHEELMELNGTYARYYQLQFEGLH